MMMLAPVDRLDVHFNVSADRRVFSDPDDRVVKVGAGFAVEKSWVQNEYRLAGGGLKLGAHQALMLPDGLKQSLGWNGRVFPQCSRAPGRSAQRRVETEESR